jgi:FixJ family two-component response regulator
MLRSGQTIVLIDDDESVRRALGRLLRSIGLRVELFATAEEYLGTELAADCFILDVDLPGLSGPELYNELIAAGRAGPTVFITAFADEKVRQAALQAGAVAFLSKPFEEQALLDALDRALT